MEHLHNSTVLVLVNQNTETPNFTTEIELVENAFYVKTGIQVNPGLVGGYIDYAGAIGFNLTSGIFENIRYYGGIRLGTIIRNGNGYPLFGYETGFNVDITDKIFIGLRSTYVLIMNSGEQMQNINLMVLLELVKDFKLEY